MPNPLRVLGLCGLRASLLMLSNDWLAGHGVVAAGAVMTFGNLQALLRKETQ